MTQALTKIKGIRMVSSQITNSFLIPRSDPNETENTKNLIVGVEQSNRVVPSSASEEVNTKKIGFYVKGRLTNASDNSNNYFNKQHQAYARIYMRDVSHMHMTPAIQQGYKWVVQHERRAIWRPHWMGWTYTTDAFTRIEIEQPTLELAIDYCNSLGFGYQVTYPRWRNSSHQIFADNFKWKGFDVEDKDS